MSHVNQNLNLWLRDLCDTVNFLNKLKVDQKILLFPVLGAHLEGGPDDDLDDSGNLGVGGQPIHRLG